MSSQEESVPTFQLTSVDSPAEPIRTAMFIAKLPFEDRRAFAVEDILGSGDVAFANGTFTHKVKATGKRFASAWALRCKLRDGKIVRFQFYEDSAAFAETNR